MPNYNNAKIYKIIGTDEELCYIGSTIEKYLSTRLNSHKSEYRKWKNGEKNGCTSFDIFEKYGVNNCKIILLEKYKCDSKDELRMKEQEYIKKNNCSNIYRAYRTRKDILEEKKRHYMKYKEKYNNYNKQYRIKNKEIISKKQTEKIECDTCNIYISRTNLSAHIKTKRHKLKIDNMYKNI